MNYLLRKGLYVVFLLIANLLLVNTYAAEYKLTSRYNLSSVYDDNWLGVRDDSTSNKEDVFGADLSGIWALGYREQNRELKGSLDLNGSYRDFQSYDNVNEKISLSFRNYTEKNQVTLFANHDRSAARDLSETVDGTGQLDVSNIDLVNTGFGMNTKHLLNEKNTVNTELSFSRRDSDSTRYIDYDNYGSSVTWEFIWLPTFSPQLSAGYSVLSVDSDPVEIFSPFIPDSFQEFCAENDLDTFIGFDCKKQRKTDSETVTQSVRFGAIYNPTETIIINFLVGKVFVDQDIEADTTDLNLSTPTDTFESFGVKTNTESSADSYTLTINHKGLRNDLELIADLGERLDSVGNLTETTRVELKSNWKISEKSSFNTSAYWTNEDYNTFSNDDDREIDRYSISTSYTYRFLREWSMSFKYFYIQTGTDLADDWVKRNRVKLSVFWRPKASIWSR